MAEFSSRGVGAAGLTTGIIGTSLGALNSGILGNLFNNNANCCSENMPVSRYELSMQNELSAKDSKIALLESNIFVDSKIADVYEKLNAKIGALEKQCCEQAIFNATQTSVTNCLGSQVAQLLSLTKLVVPGSSICPPVTSTTTATTTSII